MTWEWDNLLPCQPVALCHHHWSLSTCLLQSCPQRFLWTSTSTAVAALSICHAAKKSASNAKSTIHPVSCLLLCILCMYTIYIMYCVITIFCYPINILFYNYYSFEFILLHYLYIGKSVIGSNIHDIEMWFFSLTLDRVSSNFTTFRPLILKPWSRDVFFRGNCSGSRSWW